MGVGDGDCVCGPGCDCYAELDAPDTLRTGNEPLVITFRKARHFRRAGRQMVDLVVVHTAEMREGTGSAEALQSYCATMADGRVASWHYSVDCDSVCQSVLEADVAWHAPGANARGIGIELAARAYQTDWSGKYATSMLRLAARLVADICARWSIPIVKLGPDELLDGQRGITGHADVTRGPGKGRTTHLDPGPLFPWDRFMTMIHEAAS